MGESRYARHCRFPVGVDCIIFSLQEGRLKVLLAPRGFEPAKGVPSLMGGFVRREETISQAAERVLRELTGLDEVYMEQVGAFGELDRDPEERVVSIAYYALIKPEAEIEHRLAAHQAVWTDIDALPQLYFDHKLMIESALRMLRRKISTEPVGFSLLPESFTLAQLQTLHEAILGETLDKRNFRRRILENVCVERTGEVDKEGSRRGAALFRFNRALYEMNSKLKL